MTMCVDGTPLQAYPDLGLWVKREDLCCPPGPHFSKTRGVYAHIKNRPEPIIGVLDTHHSQGGWAVAQACKLLGKHCVLYYPVRKKDADLTGKFLAAVELKPQQKAAEDLGAGLIALPAGRSAVLYHAAKKDLARQTGVGEDYMMPNALKLPEMVSETVAEVRRTFRRAPEVPVIVSASSGTIAAGVLQGISMLPRRSIRDMAGRRVPFMIVHMGYSRPKDAVLKYITKMSGWTGQDLELVVDFVDEGYSYADAARPGDNPPFPSNQYYDLKAFRWWMRVGREKYHSAILWNVG